MTTFVLCLLAPRPDFAMTMTDDEQALMGAHAAHWQDRIEGGEVVVFGPVLDDTGSWGLAVTETADEDGLRAFAAQDPAVTSGVLRYEIGRLLTGFVRPG